MMYDDRDKDKVPQQPLHPSIIPRLDPEYIEFHNRYLQHVTPSHTLPWDPASRDGPARLPSETVPLEVGVTRECNAGPVKVQTFTPHGVAPMGGWPVFIYLHGGGWAYGSIDSDTSFSTNMCVRARCVVVVVGYRLAPENPYPAAVEDALDVLNWVAQHGESKLDVNTARIAVGGCSSGGNLAAVLALKATEQDIPLVFQLLIVPVTDNTASVATHWAENRHAPWLTPERMAWFRKMYLPNKCDWNKWDASPLFAPSELLARAPKTWIAVADVDVLRDEGIAFGRRLRQAGIDVDIETYKGGTHPLMSMDAYVSYYLGDFKLTLSSVMYLGRRLVSDAAQALAEAFETI